MKAIHGSKTKNDKIDSYKIAKLLKGGTLPMAYPYPEKMRATRDLLRRRTYMVRQCGLLLAHIQNTNTQYNLPMFKKKISRKYNREGVSERFTDPSVKASVDADLTMIDSFNQLIKQMELAPAQSSIMALLPLGCGMCIQMAEPPRGKAQELFLEGVRQGHRPVGNCKTKDGDGKLKTSGICIGKRLT